MKNAPPPHLAITHSELILSPFYYAQYVILGGPTVIANNEKAEKPKETYRVASYVYSLVFVHVYSCINYCCFR